MSKPDFEKMATDMISAANPQLRVIVADALRAAYAAGLERAAVVILGCDGWVDPNELDQLAAAIRAEKEKTDD